MNGIFTFGTTFILGFLHAFEPGHGKSILAAFSLGRTNVKSLLALISSLFVSHFLILSAFALGLQMMVSAEAVEQYLEPLEWIAPLLIMAYGGYLLYKARKHRPIESGACSCGHDHDEHHHHKGGNTRTAIVTGLIAGLIPCPTAIAPLLLSGVHDGFSSSLLHVLVYAIGMTLALFCFAGLLLLIKSLFRKKIEGWEKKLNFNVVSAAILIVIGVVYLGIYLGAGAGHHH